MRRCRLGVLGGFSLTGPHGNSLAPRNKKECALLAMLALSSRQRRSRSWLQSRLWGDSSPRRSAANLRQALLNIRHLPDPAGSIIESSRTEIWLNPDRVELEHQSALRESGLPLAGEVLEGMDIAEEPFEEWLSNIRQWYQRPRRAASSQNSLSEHRFDSTPATPTFLFQMPVADSTPQTLDAANHLLDHLIDGARTFSGALLEDRRNISMAEDIDLRRPTPLDCEITLRLRREGGLHMGYLMVTRIADRRVLWNTRVEFSARRGAKHSERFARTTQLFIDFLINKEQRLAGIESAGDNAGLAVGVALTGLFTPGRFDMATVRRYLDTAIGTQPSGLQFALRAMTSLYQFGDRKADSDVESAISADLRAAQQLDPSNAVIHALSGQVAGFYRLSPGVALDHTATAIALAPNNPICQVMRATSLLYAGEQSKAYSLALQARQAGRTTFVQPVVESICCMAAALSGQFQQSIVHGELAIEGAPEFRPPLLHLLGSYAHLKQGEEAIRIREKLKKRDPDFSAELLASPEYPLASHASRQFVVDGMVYLGPN
ncbi:MAG: hypothetical protein ACRBC3_11205 [Burkholderiaceae bacterium]